MRVNLDLTKSNPNNLISDESLYIFVNVAHTLNHDFFFGGSDLEVWSAVGKTGTKYTENVDYTLGGINVNLSQRTEENVYSTITFSVLDKVTRYISYRATADKIKYTDKLKMERSSTQYIDLSLGPATTIVLPADKNVNLYGRIVATDLLSYDFNLPVEDEEIIGDWPTGQIRETMYYSFGNKLAINIDNGTTWATIALTQDIFAYVPSGSMLLSGAAITSKEDA